MIVNEIFYVGANKFFDQIAASLDRVQDPEKRARIFIDEAIRILAENREFFRIYVEFPAKESESPEVKKMMNTFYTRFTETLMQIFREGIQAGVFMDFDYTQMARAVYFLMIGALFARFTMKVDFDLDVQNKFQIDSILASIKKN